VARDRQHAKRPAITHSNDFSLVTTVNPAKSGEILSLIAKGLGPTRPGVDPGQPFTADPLQVVNSPVEVTVNGMPGEVCMQEDILVQPTPIRSTFGFLPPLLQAKRASK